MSSPKSTDNQVEIYIHDSDEAVNEMRLFCVNTQVADALRGGIFLASLNLRVDGVVASCNVNGWMIPKRAFKVLRKTYGKAKSRKS